MSKDRKKRILLKSVFAEGAVSDQQKGLPQPALTKKQENKQVIELPQPQESDIPEQDIIKIIKERRSRRHYKKEPLTLKQISLLLWASQGVKKVIDRDGKSYATLRTVPSAGARHPFETYLLVQNSEGLKKGVYHYLALEHKLEYLFTPADMKKKILATTFQQKFTGNAPVVFVWSVIPYRTEWRYDKLSYKPILLDAGHVCQNLYLMCETMNLGTCAIAAYNQELIDNLLKLDGEDEFVIYLAPVGKR